MKFAFVFIALAFSNPIKQIVKLFKTHTVKSIEDPWFKKLLEERNEVQVRNLIPRLQFSQKLQLPTLTKISLGRLIASVLNDDEAIALVKNLDSGNDLANHIAKIIDLSEMRGYIFVHAMKKKKSKVIETFRGLQGTMKVALNSEQFDDLVYIALSSHMEDDFVMHFADSLLYHFNLNRNSFSEFSVRLNDIPRAADSLSKIIEMDLKQPKVLALIFYEITLQDLIFQNALDNIDGVFKALLTNDQANPIANLLIQNYSTETIQKKLLENLFSFVYTKKDTLNFLNMYAFYVTNESFTASLGLFKERMSFTTMYWYILDSSKLTSRTKQFLKFIIDNHMDQTAKHGLLKELKGVSIPQFAWGLRSGQ